MSSGAFSRRDLRIGAMCRREAIIALKSSKKSPWYPSGKRKIAMLPTCIGISGVSRYRNDASMADSFLASLIGPSRKQLRGTLIGAFILAFRRSLLTLGFWFRIVPARAAHMQWQRARTGQIG